ncbi:MAG: hypothetical protein NT105_11870 [Verrucomicrobia bacterium]|nr:hypothetical protein [Verrucomicrobiota bacterium]
MEKKSLRFMLSVIKVIVLRGPSIEPMDGVGKLTVLGPSLAGCRNLTRPTVKTTRPDQIEQLVTRRILRDFDPAPKQLSQTAVFGRDNAGRSGKLERMTGRQSAPVVKS